MERTNKLMKRQSPAAFLLFVFLAIAILAGCAGSNRPAEMPHPKTIEELQHAVQSILTREHVPGAGIALVDKDHVIWAGGVGKADLAAGKDVSADTMFRAGSISKSFVALALLKMQEEGRIDLNTKLADLAGEIPVHNPWEATNPVRVVNLLEHTAGFDDMHFSGAYNVIDKPDIALLDVLQKFSSPFNVRWAPGNRFSYSNPGYGAAGYLIEKINHQPFDEYIRATILIPLGMINSDFRLTNLNQPVLARGYEGDSPKPVPYVSIYLRPAGDLKSSPAEMARFVQMMLNRGKLGDAEIVRPESIDRMEHPQTTLAARAGLKDGYGLGNYADLDGPVVAHGHNGGIDGFLSQYGYMPTQGFGFVVLLNSSSSSRALRDISRLVRNYLQNDQPAPKQVPVNLSADELAKFAGYYEQTNPRHDMFAFLDYLLAGRKVFVSGGTLFEKGWFDQAKTLVPVGSNQFRLEDQPEASRIFFTDQNGKSELAGFQFEGVQTSPLWPTARLWLVLIGLIVMATSIPFALAWVPLKLMGKMKGVPHLSLRYVSLLAVLSLLAAFLILNNAPSWWLGTYNIITVGIWLFTWAFVVLSLWGLWLSLRSFKLEVKPALRIHSLLVSIACCGIAGYLAYWHIIGVRLWAP
jgi:CubicO group peptidase (beta-lactamase class C family)